MKVTYLFGILVASALSVGCVAQAGTEDPASSGQELTATNAVAADQQPEQQAALSPKAKLVRSPRLLQAQDAPVQQIQGLQTTVTGMDPGAPVQDDGDGKEPDPHPWHMDTATVAAH